MAVTEYMIVDAKPTVGPILPKLRQVSLSASGLIPIAASPYGPVLIHNSWSKLATRSKILGTVLGLVDQYEK